MRLLRTPGPVIAILNEMRIPDNILLLAFNFILTKVFRTNKKYPLLANVLILFSVPIFNLLRKASLRLYRVLATKYKKYRSNLQLGQP